MKKILLLIAILFININVLAFDINYSYNYQVDSFSLSGSTLSVSGWAIINAGCKDGSTGSTQSPQINNACANGYKYTLFINTYNSSGSSLGTVSVGPYSATAPNMYKVMCMYQSSGGCNASTSAQYENAGFNFSVNLKSLFSANYDKIAKFTLQLQIQAGGSCPTKPKFNLSVPSNKINDSSQEFQTSGNLDRVSIVGNDVLVSIRSYNGYNYARVSPNYFELCQPGPKCGARIPHSNNSKVTSVSSDSPAKYSFTLCSNDGKNICIDVKNLSAGFVAPAKGNASSSITKPSSSGGTTTPSYPSQPASEPEPFRDCRTSLVSYAPGDLKLGKCSGVVSKESAATGGTCVTSSGSYYSVSCREKNQVEYSGMDYKEEFTRGIGYGFNVKIKSTFSCRGSFNYNEWSREYDRMKKELNNLSTTSTNYLKNKYMYEGNIKRLEEIYDEFLDSGKLEPKGDPIVNLQADYSVRKEAKTDTVKFVKASSTSKVIANVNSNYKTKYTSAPSDFSQELEYDYTYIPAMMYYDNNIQGPVGYKSDNVVSLENKVYLNNSIDANSKYKMSIKISNLGYAGNWTSSNTCQENVAAEELTYRRFDIVDPFIMADNKRGIGQNWLNSSFDFTQVAKNNSNLNSYSFELDKEAITSIKKTNTPESYAGSECTLNKNTLEYSCPITNKYSNR